MQLTIVVLNKSVISDMHQRITYTYFNFQQNRVSRSVKKFMRTTLFAKKITSCINLQLPIVIKKKYISDMYHRINDMYANFQQNSSSRQNRPNKIVKTVHTNVFVKNRKYSKQTLTGLEQRCDKIL